jgi:hypothetical protein
VPIRFFPVKRVLFNYGFQLLNGTNQHIHIKT